MVSDAYRVEEWRRRRSPDVGDDFSGGATSNRRTVRGPKTRRREDRTMSRVSTYLNFMGTTEEAFDFYRSIFGTEFTADPARMGDLPSEPGAPQLPQSEKGRIA